VTLCTKILIVCGLSNLMGYKIFHFRLPVLKFTRRLYTHLALKIHRKTVTARSLTLPCLDDVIKMAALTWFRNSIPKWSNFDKMYVISKLKKCFWEKVIYSFRVGATVFVLLASKSSVSRCYFA